MGPARDHSVNPATGGAWEPQNPAIAGSVRSANGHSATIALPDSAGYYRVHVYVYDPSGSAATANLPVVADPAVPPASTRPLPGRTSIAPSTRSDALHDCRGRFLRAGKADEGLHVDASAGMYVRAGQVRAVVRSAVGALRQHTGCSAMMTFGSVG